MSIKKAKHTTKDPPGLCVNVEHVCLENTMVQQPTRELVDALLEVEVRDVLVIAKLKVLPLFNLDDLLTTDCLLDLLLLLVYGDYVTPPNSLTGAIGAGCVRDDVRYHVDAIKGPRHQPICGDGQPADGAFAVGGYDDGALSIKVVALVAGGGRGHCDSLNNKSPLPPF